MIKGFYHEDPEDHEDFYHETKGLVPPSCAGIVIRSPRGAGLAGRARRDATGKRMKNMKSLDRKQSDMETGQGEKVRVMPHSLFLEFWLSSDILSSKLPILHYLQDPELNASHRGSLPGNNS
jgi:hypothetical protein